MASCWETAGHDRAPLINETVIGDAEKPGVEIASGSETIQGCERFEQGFLNQVFSSLAMMREVVEPAVKPLPVGIGQLCKGLPVALLRLVNQPHLCGLCVEWFFSHTSPDPEGGSAS